MKTKNFVPAVLALGLTLTSAFSKKLPVTQEEQSKLTPEIVLKDLLDGNKRYVAGEHTKIENQKRIKAATKGQYPKAFILSCIDSRVPVESVFDQGLGDIFVGRVAGNFENKDQLGSMEFAAKVAGVKLVMVLGHEACGAVKGACDHVELGNITHLVGNIKPAVDKVAGEMEGKDHSSKNADFVAAVVNENVKQTIADIRANSPVLVEMEKNGEVKIVGGVYSLQDGSVTLLD